WFGIGVIAKVVTAFTLVFFILLVNTLGGAKNVDNDILTIARLMGASERDILWKVTFPSALPWIFTGLNLGLTYSLLGVIVAEILASNHGLGYLIASSAASFNTAGVFAGLITLSVVAWLFSVIMRKIEARLLRWKPWLRSACDGQHAEAAGEDLPRRRRHRVSSTRPRAGRRRARFQLRGAGRLDRDHRRSVRLRQVDDPQHRLRPHAAEQGQGRGGRPP